MNDSVWTGIGKCALFAVVMLGMGVAYTLKTIGMILQAIGDWLMDVCKEAPTT